MKVTDPDGVADEDLLSEIEGAVADFEAWTGRDGVCVPSIRVQADVPEEEPGSDVVGMYQGDHQPILVQSGSVLSAHEIVIHELCHALDYHEDLSESWPAGAFRAEDITEDLNYPKGAKRTHEDFARTCDDAPDDLTLVLALDAQCGTQSWGDDGKFIASVVYPQFPSATINPEPFSFDVRSTVLAFGSDYWIYGAVGVEGELLVLVDRLDEGIDRGRVGVLRIDPTTGEVEDWVEILTGVPEQWLRLALSDEALVALISRPGTGADGEEPLTEAFRFDPTTGTTINLGLEGLPTSPGAAAYIDGILYVSSYTGLSSWDTSDGSRTDLDTDPSISRLVPTPEGLEKETLDGVFRLVEGSWVTLVTKPAYFWSFLPMGGDQRLWLGGPSSTLAIFDGASSEWRLPEDACTPQDIFSNVSMLTVDGEPFVLGETAYGSGVPALFGLDVQAAL